ncbi:DUF1206 domain-containing protein [bacterium]|nr:MAG: DUF1206 domain-containing protein [bacterium]
MAQVAGKAHHAVRETEPWIKTAARLGYIAKGVVFAAIGLLALLAATGRGGGAADQKDAVNLLADLPFGPAIATVVGIGLLGYALWRLLEAIRNPEGQKAFKRIGYFISSVTYGGLGIAALRAALGSKEEADAKGAAATVLQQPGGQAILIVAGLVLLAAGVASIVNAWKASFMKVLCTEEMDEHARHVTKTAGRIGLAARGVVFMMTGSFLTKAGLDANAKEAGGIQEALQTLARSPYGPWLLGLMAIGLLSYAAYLALEAKYRRMAPLAASEGHG